VRAAKEKLSNQQRLRVRLTVGILSAVISDSDGLVQAGAER
jgi:hypothetical protein